MKSHHIFLAIAGSALIGGSASSLAANPTSPMNQPTQSQSSKQISKKTLGQDQAQILKKIQGIVKISSMMEKKLIPGGVLFIFARKAGIEAGPPVAAIRIENPKFPQQFVLDSSKVMIPGTPFKGNFNITARYSPSGDALDKKGGFQGEFSEKESEHMGKDKIEILMNKSL